MNASRMARYMMMARAREGGRDNRGGDRGGNYEARNEYERMGGRDYGMRNEGGDYGRSEMNYDMDSRFRDRRGREHYDNGRFAPRNNYPMENRGNDRRGGERSGGAQSIMPWYPDMADRRGRENGDGMRSAYDDEDDDGRMNMIGFDRPQEVTSHYPTRIDYHGGDEMEHRSGMKMAGGAMGAGMEFNEEIAKEWTKKMHNEDGSKGEHWTMEQVKKLMTQRGIEYNLAEVYAIMNALYSDYCKVFKKYGFNSPEAYLDLALAWLNDSDAVKNKAMMYYECIVKH